MPQIQLEELMGVVATVEKLSGASICLHEVSTLLSSYIPGIPVYHRNSVCMAVKHQVHGNSRQCILFDRNAVKFQLHQGSTPFFKHCPFGMTELVIPLLRENETLGIVFLGPFKCDARNLSPDSLIGQRSKSCPENLPENMHIRVLDRESMRDIYNLGELLKSYFARLLEGTVFKEISPDSRREQIEKYIDKNFTRQLQLADLADFLFLSESRTVQLLQKYFKCGFTELITRRRMKHARNMLERSDLAVKLIAANTGYSNIEYFYRVFRKVHGMTPQQYRSKQAK